MYTGCLQYGLPPPSTWLSAQPTKLQVKFLAKDAVLRYWLQQFRAQADSLPSLKYLQTRYMGLTKCHPGLLHSALIGSVQIMWTFSLGG